jgi:hypothetical protein
MQKLWNCVLCLILYVFCLGDLEWDWDNWQHDPVGHGPGSRIRMNAVEAFQIQPRRFATVVRVQHGISGGKRSHGHMRSTTESGQLLGHSSPYIGAEVAKSNNGRSRYMLSPLNANAYRQHNMYHDSMLDERQGLFSSLLNSDVTRGLHTLFHDIRIQYTFFYSVLLIIAVSSTVRAFGGNVIRFSRHVFFGEEKEDPLRSRQSSPHFVDIAALNANSQARRQQEAGPTSKPDSSNSVDIESILSSISSMVSRVVSSVTSLGNSVARDGASSSATSKPAAVSSSVFRTDGPLQYECEVLWLNRHCCDCKYALCASFTCLCG